MTKTSIQVAAAVLSAVMSLAVVAGMNGVATQQYVKAERLAMVSTAQTDVAQAATAGHRAA